MLNVIILIVSVLSLISIGVLAVMFYKLHLKREEMESEEDPKIVCYSASSNSPN